MELDWLLAKHSIGCLSCAWATSHVLLEWHSILCLGNIGLVGFSLNNCLSGIELAVWETLRWSLEWRLGGVGQIVEWS